MNYRKVFENKYKKSHISHYNDIKKNFINYKNKKRSFGYAFDMVKKDINSVKYEILDINNVNLNTIFNTLYYSFYNYEEGSYFLVFDNELISEYKSRINKIDYTYEELILRLAEHVALHTIQKVLETPSLRAYWEEIYGTLNFNNYFINFVDFTYFKYQKDRNLEILTDNLSKLNNNKKHDGSAEIILPSNKFKINPDYKHIFEQESFYSYISAYFLEDNISFSDFKVFFIYGKVLNKEIRFTENNFYAYRLLYAMKEFYKKFEIKYILENQIVKNYLDKRLNEKDISSAKYKYKHNKIKDLESKILKILSYKK